MFWVWEEIKVIIIFVGFDCNVKVVASSIFSLDLDLEALKWCHMSMDNHPKGG